MAELSWRATWQRELAAIMSTKKSPEPDDYWDGYAQGWKECLRYLREYPASRNLYFKIVDEEKHPSEESLQIDDPSSAGWGVFMYGPNGYNLWIKMTDKGNVYRYSKDKPCG